MLHKNMNRVLLKTDHITPRKPSMIGALIVLGSIFSIAPGSHADETNKRGDVFCFPAEDVPKLVDKLATVKPKYRDVVDVTIDPKFLIKDGGIWPEKFYLSREGDVVKEMAFSRDDGRVPTFMQDVREAPDTDICVLDPSRSDQAADYEGLYFEMGLSPFFTNKSGRYTLEELKEGIKDGKKFYKKMIPAAISFLMPNTDYLAVKYEDTSTVLEAFAEVDGQEIALPSERHKDFDVISFDDIKKLNATTLIIRGGAYNLQPVPSPKFMRRIGWGQDAEDSKSDKD